MYMRAKLKIILKTKDEGFLIEPWLRYYSALIGAENIIVYDDYSTLPSVLSVYEKYSNSVDIRKLPQDQHMTRKIPKEHHQVSKVDRLHTFNPLKEELKDSCDYYTILDTDEFLCFFNYEKQEVDNSMLMAFIKDNSDRNAFLTSWINNVYYGADFTSIFDVTNFNLRTVNPRLGKSIVTASGEAGGNITHNISLGFRDKKIPLKFSPELLLLHLQDVNWESRILSRINFAKSFDLEFKDIPELLELCRLEGTVFPSYMKKDLLGYYEDKENFLIRKSGASRSANLPILRTDILEASIFGKKSTSSFLNFDENFAEYLTGKFKEGFKETNKFLFD